MTVIPALSYVRILAALKRLGFVVLRQRGSHIRMKRIDADGQVVFITIPAHQPVYPHTLSKILKQASISIDKFLEAL